MEIIAKIADKRIRKAMERGEFDNLHGAEKPLTFEDETWMAEDLRLAYRILKTSGYILAEIETRKEILNLKDLMLALDDDRERLKKIREMNFLILKLNMASERPLNLGDFLSTRKRSMDSIRDNYGHH
ncbi:MAG: DnaJ family domain-containing protein [Thermodesulfovibrionales bacterium]|jgi:hypothetical protein